MMRCAGCGSTETLKQIRTKHPRAISCCPERKMKITCRYVQGREHTKVILGKHRRHMSQVR
jgi:hypothetical protein